MEHYVQAKELCKILGIPEKTIARMGIEGTLPSYKIPGSKHRLYRVSEILGLIERNETEQNG